ncbi:hypothetical protein [Flavimaricola marinus]|uniref:Uncharacterized protein n=1 Tax=Flavimaricola marinus TaxID=1819565 RepID=A0A238LGT6_9RHOB|nr:hypothetical protein [Flavimaricola marinus]SMY08782.1 hypothetical protein LOM8899_02938 [Flavimaricola marinus]
MRATGLGAMTVMALAMAGCAIPPVGLGDFVPVRQLLAETEGLPYQCVRLNPDSESCNLVSTLRRVGGEYELKSQFAMSFGQTMYLDVTERLVERNGTICVVSEQYTTVLVGGGPAIAGMEGFEDVAPPAPPEMPLCYAYYRGIKGGYVSAELDSQGRLDPASAYPVTFLASSPRLQAVGIP